MTKLLKIESLASSLSQEAYFPQFDSHLQRLMTIDFNVHSESIVPIALMSQKRYMGMQQTALELGDRYEKREPSDVDWDRIDRDVERIERNLRRLLGHEATSDLLKPLIRRTSQYFEYWAIYNMMYPKSRINPWKPTLSILERGLLVLTSDDPAFLNEYLKDIRLVGSRERGYNLAVIVKGKSRRIQHKALDNVYMAQTIVFEFLRAKGRGLGNSRSLGQIHEHLKSMDLDFGNTNNIQIEITTPLKKTGLIGSTINGFFFIETADDLKATFEFHHKKSKSILLVMERYKQRAREFKVDLESLIDEE